RVGRTSEGDEPLQITFDFDTPRMRLLAPGVARREARFLVSLAVDDGLHEPIDIELLVVALSSNQPPAVTAVDLVAVLAGEDASVSVSATDPDGDAVTLMAGLRGVSGAPTPALAAALRAFNQADATEAGGTYTKPFEYTTDDTQDGSYVDISWTADDGVGSGSARTRVVVGQVDLPPAIKPIARQTVEEGGFLEVEIVAIDPDGDPEEDLLTYLVTGMSGGATFDPITHTFLWPSVPFGAAGRHLLTVHVTDVGGNTTVAPIDITVTDVNQSPTVVLGDTPAEEDTPALLTIVRGAETVYVARAFDADGDDVQLAIAELPDWVRGRRVGDRKNPAAVLALQAPDEAEAFSFVVRARDAGGLTVEGTVSVTIEEPENLAPRIEAPLAQSVLTGDTLNVFVPVVDPDGDSVSLTVSPRPVGLQVADAAGGFRLRWTLVPADARDEAYDLTLTVSDERGAEATASFLVSVSAPANRPPTGGDAVPVVVQEGDQVDLDLLAGVTDPDGDALSLELTTDLPPTAYTLPAGETILTVAPEAGDAGAYQAEVTILDGRGGRLVHGWSITVPGEDPGRLEILSTTPTVIESTIDGAYRFVAVITTPDDRPPDLVTVTVTHNSGLSRELDMTATGIGDLADGAVFAVETRLPEGVYRYVVEAELDGEAVELRGEGPRVGATLVAFAQIRALGRTGRIPFVYALQNPNPAGRTNLSVEYRRDVDDPWIPAAVTGDLIEVTSGVQLGFVWDSDVDVPDAASEAIQIRVTPEDGVPRVLTIRVANVPPAAPSLDPVAPSSVTKVRLTGRNDTPGATIDIVARNGATVGTTIAESDGAFAVTVTAPVGRNLIRAVAALPGDVDGNGRRSLPSEPVEVIVDTAPPVLRIVAPARGSSVATRTPAISVRADFGISGGDIDSAEMRLSGKPIPVEFSPESGVFTASKEIPDLRVVLVTFVVRKANGLSASVAWTFTVDLSAADVRPPDITAVRPSGVTRRATRVEAAVRDAESGVDPDSIGIALDGVDLAAAFLPEDARSGLAVADIPRELPQGVYEITVTVADRAGNEVSETSAFEVAGAVDAPVLDVSVDLGPTNTPVKALTGSGPPGVDVAVFVNDDLGGVARVDEDGTWALPVRFSTEGVQLLQAQARDEFGVQSARAVFGRVIYDLTPPRVVLAVPALGSVTGDLNPSFIGTATDGLSGVDADTFDFSLSVPASSSYDAVVGRFTGQADDPFADGGSVDIRVTVADLAGNMATLEGPLSFDVRLDDVTSPAILTASIDGATLTEGVTPKVEKLPATVTLNVVDDRSGVSIVAGLLDGDAVEFALDGGSATLVVDGLADGEHILMVRASDGEGNTATVRRYTFAVGAPLAAPTIVAPDITASPDLTITGVGVAPSATLRLLVNDAPVEVAVVGDAFTSAPARLEEGGNTVTAIVEDASGAQARVSQAVLLDTEAPRVTFLDPLGGAAVGPDTRTIRLRLDDNTGVDAASTSLTVDGEVVLPVVADDGSVEYIASGPFSASGTGETRRHSARATVRDVAGNVGSAGLVFVVDANAPVIEGLLPGDGEIIRTLEPTISAAIAARDVDPSTLDVLFGIDGDPVASVIDDPNFEYLFSVGTFIYTPLVEDGETYRVVVRVADEAGNASERAWTFSVDTSQEDVASPIITVLFPQPGQSINDTGLDILSFSLGDVDGIDPSRVHLFVNDPTGSTPMGLGRLEDEGIAQFDRKTGIVRILGSRLFAPYQGSRGGFSFDPLELNALERSLTGGDNASFDPLELNSLERSLSGAESSFEPPAANTLASSLGGGGGGLASGMERSLNTGAGLLGFGQNTMGVQVADLSGNVSFATWSFTVSLDPPAAPVFDDMPAATGETATTVSGHVPGLLTGSGLPVIVDLRVNSVSAGRVEITETDGLFAFSSVAIAAGENVMTATAQDDAGNLSDRSDTLTIVGDSSAPVVTLTSMPSALPNPTFFLSGKVTDDRGEAPTSLTVMLNGEAIELSAALGSFSREIPLTGGLNTLSVEARDPAGNIGSSPEFTIAIDVASPTTAPPSVTVRPTTDARGLTLSWPADAEASQYVVYRSPTFFTTGASAERIAQPATTTYTDTNITFGSTHYYAIGSADAAGNTDVAVLSPTINVALIGENGGTASLDDGTQVTVPRGGLFTSPLQTATVSLSPADDTTPLTARIDGTARLLSAVSSSGRELATFERVPSLRIPVTAEVDLVEAPPIMRRLVDATWAKLDSEANTSPRGVTADAPGAGTYQLSDDVPDRAPWDVNGDGAVTIIDLVTVARLFGQVVVAGEPADTNADGTVSIIDLVTVASHFGESTAVAAPSLGARAGADATVSMRVLPANAERAFVEVEIHASASTPIAGYEFRVGYDPTRAALRAVEPGDLLPDPTFWAQPIQARGTAHVAAVRLDLADAYAEPARDGLLARVILDTESVADGLLQLRDIRLSDARGELIPYRVLPMQTARETYRTELFPNYPNPFNPETWIPFALESGSDVTIDIYDVQGERVRTLNLGRRAAGAYASRDEAAYWDGRNERGEAAASGVYFVELRAGTTRVVRRMTIAK
ncbi:hypothetical protein HOI71_07165, partial [Candidatus Poribacteria bacterium]|nr:hypothetical protein [Candidatus Poribacteria bacterium]